MWGNEDLKAWYALFVLGGQEEKVKKSLDAEYGNEMEVIIPTRQLRERKAGQWYQVKRKLFPGYVLIKSKMTVETYYQIKDTPGLIKLLRDEEEPLKIQDEELEVLNILIKNREGNIGISILFKENDQVKVVDGPLVGLEGLIKDINKRKGRAKVKLQFLGEERVIDLGIELVDKI
ncbi:antiterminator LoaP [Vallitalea okinawensis]|uniref:antiterminator LoaP n=1 Tax=Vallitalea okinawensis TaxID=2078660 RepID=UPI000CFCFCD7|nr:antiterminator LoaP [Vallitalea okinawensis]